MLYAKALLAANLKEDATLPPLFIKGNEWLTWQELEQIEAAFKNAPNRQFYKEHEGYLGRLQNIKTK